jgi:hypothetical protein
MLTRCIAVHDKSDSEDMTKKKQLTLFFEDIAQTMVKFPDGDLGETKREIFKLVNRNRTSHAETDSCAVT